MSYVNTVFTEDPLEVQATEFAAYTSKLKGEPEEGGAFLVEVANLLKENKSELVFQKLTAETATILDAPEKDFEPLFNLLIAILKSASPETHDTLIKSSIQALVNDKNEKAIQKLKVLQNLYNTLEYTSTLRYYVFLAILDIATQYDEIETLLPQLSRLDIWVREWAISKEQTRELYLRVSEKLEEAGEVLRAYDFLLKYLATYTSSNDLNVAKEAARRAIVQSIKFRETFRFEDLLELEAVEALKEEKIFELLQVFLGGNLKEYKAFIEKNLGFVEKLGLSNDDNIRKIRLLTLASLASEHVSREISYNTIAKALEIDEEEVEMWTIDVIRANLMEAKINQVQKTIFVNRTTYRTFTMAQWQQLSSKFEGWRESLDDILQVIANAKLIAQNPNSLILVFVVIQTLAVNMVQKRRTRKKNSPNDELVTTVTPTPFQSSTMPKLQIPKHEKQGSSGSRRNNSATIEDVEQIVNETFFLKHEEPKPFLTRKRVIFTAGLLFGLAIAWAFTEPTTVHQFHTLSNFITGSFPDLDFTSLLPANILVDELIGNMTMYLKPKILVDTEFMPGLKLATSGLRGEHPVILVPGIVSTGLESWSTSNCSQKYFRKRMWGTTAMFRAVLLDKECWKDHMKLDPVTGLDPPGVKLRAAQGLDAADYLFPGYWVWGKMIQNFASIGYDSNNMHLAAYDWRLSIYNLETRDKYYSKLKGTIEMAKKLDRKKSVIVAHSLGSTVVLYFLKWVESPMGGNGGPNWVNDHIESFINIGGPLLGLPKALSALLSGEMRDTVELGAFGIYLLERFFSKRERSELFRTWGGLASMLPKGGEAVWGNNTHAPDDKFYDAGTERESYGPMLTFRLITSNKNKTKDQTDNENHLPNDETHLTYHHTCPSVVNFLQNHTNNVFSHMLSTNYSFGIAENLQDFRDDVDHTKWSNPLESRLPYAPDMKIYCLYGVGKETERRYYYSHDEADTNSHCEGCTSDEKSKKEPHPNVHHFKYKGKIFRNVFIDSSINIDNQGLKSGIHTGEGDGTVPLLSLGYMCVKGWKNPLYNPAGIKVITREFVHETSPSFDLRGGAKTADHVDILGNYAVTEDVLRIAAAQADSIENTIHSRIEEYAARAQL
ncbi:hypothetical protein G9A89_008274 [Geosiphon pyriformis]|nr:hypothetical protein G9A89_008274 [Geosiphon pyriformis]